MKNPDTGSARDAELLPMSKANCQYTLPVGTMVQEYKIIETLGTGNFGIVYSAENKYFLEIVVLKEFLPSDLACRCKGNCRVHPLGSNIIRTNKIIRLQHLL